MRTINNIFTVLVMICNIFLIIIPLPRLFLEIAFGIELLLGIILYVYSKNNFVEKFQRRIPYLVLIYNPIILSVSISVLRLCLITKEFPIRYISILYGSNSITNLFGIIFSICIFVATIYFVQKCKKTIKSKCARCFEHQSEDSDKDEIDYYSEVDGTSEFLVGTLKVSILMLCIIIVLGAVFNISMRDETFANSISYSIKNGIMFVLVLFLPLLLSSRVLLENLSQFEHIKFDRDFEFYAKYPKMRI